MTDPIVALFAEDEPIIQMAIEEALEEGGFAVVTAGSGLDAAALLESRHSELRALVTDIRIGSGPDGWELAHRARALNGQIAVVYITGDSCADWPANGVPKSVIIQKPFAEAQLLTALSTLLTAAG
jgi:CheY-like chemotaxis protein